MTHLEQLMAMIEQMSGHPEITLSVSRGGGSGGLKFFFTEAGRLVDILTLHPIREEQPDKSEDYDSVIA
jgi:hypothetical protein